MLFRSYMPHYEYDKDYPFAAFITNLGKYNEGDLVGEWVKRSEERRVGKECANQSKAQPHREKPAPER